MPASPVDRSLEEMMAVLMPDTDEVRLDTYELGDLSRGSRLDDVENEYEPSRPLLLSTNYHSADSDGIVKASSSTYAASILSHTSSLSSERKRTRPDAGWWTGQMLVDRSFRTMAGLMTTLAVVLVAVTLSCVPKLAAHLKETKQSTSISFDSGSQKSMKIKSQALKLIINIAATMVLGCSNTYQQLLTALEISDLQHMLRKYGDSRVGTNSPFAINHKRKGRKAAWAAWIFLICTSMPVHLLANSLVGVSEHQTVAIQVKYNSTTDVQHSSSDYTPDPFLCYSAFRLGQVRINDKNWQDGFDEPYKTTEMDHYPSNIHDKCYERYDDNVDIKDVTTCFGSITVNYVPELCKKYLNASGLTYTTIQEEWDRWSETQYPDIGSCYWYYNISCVYTDLGQGCSGPEYNLVLRMQAAIILTACIVAKACYMLISNLKARNKMKTHCLTFGDVIVASILDRDIKIPNECMVNGGSFHRRQVRHDCHKHCSSKEDSTTGEELGHCQKCTRFNNVDNLPMLTWPVLATKRKKSLLTNLSQMALTQILTLSFCSMAMIGASVVIGVILVPVYAYAVCEKWTTYATQFTSYQWVATMGNDSLLGEISAFAISNGAQLLYSMLYLLMLYNITLISMEYEWGQMEKKRSRLRCTIVNGSRFDQSYLLQLPKKILLPLMGYSVLMHWLLGLAILAEETTVTDDVRQWSRYDVVTVPAAVWGSTVLLLAMTCVCWWAFTYRREGFIPQMYGSIRTICSSTSELKSFTEEGIIWGDLGMGTTFRHAGFSTGPVDKIVPNELYAGRE